MRILKFMVKDGELDGELLQFIYDKEVHIQYAKQELTQDQLDL